MMRTIVRGGLIALLTSVLAACGGGGSDGVDGAPGAAGPATSVTNPGIQAPSLTGDAWAKLLMQGQITSVSVSGAPVITFRVTDTNGNAIVGLDQMYSMPAGATLPTQRVVSASIAKLVAGTNGSPSKWVNFIVVRVDTGSGEFTGLRTPSTDANGTLEYLGDGEYKYTMAVDVTKVKAFVDASTDANKADVGDTTWDPSLPYRAVIQISGPARNTGNNTPDGSNSPVAAVNLEEAVNFTYDSTAPQRDIVAIESCNECHSHLAFHGGGARVDTKFCVVCHTNQRKYGQSAATLGTYDIVYDDGSTKTVPSWNKEPRKYPNGEASRDFPIMIHSIHRGEYLPVRMAASYIDEVKFPQPATNCATCHTGDASAWNATPQGDNWKNNPSRRACGACHNDVDFATGLNHPAPGGARADDSSCKSCHSATAIATVYHTSVDPVGSEGRGGYPVNTATDVPTPGYPRGQGPGIPLSSATNPPAGVPVVGFDINAVTVASGKVSIKYRITFDGTPVTFLPAGDPYLLAHVDGTPSLYVSYAMPEDGVATAIDWTASFNATVLACRDQSSSCKQTGPDASGYYTATLQTTLPAGATLVTGMLGINYQGFVKLDHPDFPKGIRLREPYFQIKTASGYTARRAIVEAARCNKCHNQLGVEPSFHSGARNNPAGCATGGCHYETKSTGHTGEANDYGGGWALSAKSMVHAIHAASKRQYPFNYEATAQNLKGFGTVTYPGILNNCEQCHVPGSYNFGISANMTAAPNLLWATDANANMTNPNNAPSIGLSPWIDILGKGQIDYRYDNLVSSPIAAACFACHDSNQAVTHIQQNGGRLLALVSEITGQPPGTAAQPASRDGLTAINTETCLVCHGQGKVADTKIVHEVRGVTLH